MQSIESLGIAFKTDFESPLMKRGFVVVIFKYSFILVYKSWYPIICDFTNYRLQIQLWVIKKEVKTFLVFTSSFGLNVSY